VLSKIVEEGAVRIDHWSTHPGEDGYTDPALLMPCPQRQTPLRMNPFFVAPPPL
jgi:hypothetical protein